MTSPRTRSQTIGTLGRTPARTSKQQPIAKPPDEPPKAEPGAVRRWIQSALFDNLLLKFLSMILAITVFLLVSSDRDDEITVTVGLKYRYPPDKVLTSPEVKEVRVTIKGPERRTKEFDERRWGDVTLNLDDAPNGDIPLMRTAIPPDLPPGLKVVDYTPRTVRVAFDRRVEKLVEIVPATIGRPQHGYVLAEVKAVPATAKIKGGEKLLGSAITSIRTHEVSLEKRTEPFEEVVELAPAEGVEVVEPLSVRVQVRIDEELVTRKTPGLVVQVKGEGVDAAKWSVTPAQVEVVLTGALLAVEKARLAITPIIKLTANDRAAREVEVTIEGLPPGVGVRVSPERVKVAPVK